MAESENSRSLLRLSISNSAAAYSNSLSPMTDLAHTLGGLTTGGIATPKRRISWSSVSSASSTPASTASDDAFSWCDGSNKALKECNPPGEDSPLKESRVLKDVTAQNNSNSNRQKPVPFSLPSTPVTGCFLSSALNKENVLSERSNSCTCSACQQEPIDTASSQDSGYSGCHNDKECTGKTCFSFETPSLSRRLRLSSSDESPQKQESQSDTKCKRLTSCKDSVEDDFLEDFIANDLNEETQFPAGISKLLESPLSFSEAGILPEESLLRRTFPRKFSMPVNTTSLEEFIKKNEDDKLPFKRPDPPHCEVFQIHHKKRRKAISFCSPDGSSPEDHHPALPPKKFPNLQRCYSETEATIKKALQISSLQPNLIGDTSRTYALPLVVGKHEDLKCIEPLTVKMLLEGHYQDSIDKHVIVDCRYPYEYEGGHIKGAKNIYTKDGILREFLSNPPQNSENERLVIIFHCEFSSERGPTLTRFLRGKDREANKDCYPALHYPELYLLNGGYKAFYESYKILCEPQAYKPMNHKDHGAEMRQFRAKSKSWNAESKARIVVRPGLKF